jgi:hypothetical protein
MEPNTALNVSYASAVFLRRRHGEAMLDSDENRRLVGIKTPPRNQQEKH